MITNFDHNKEQKVLNMRGGEGYVWIEKLEPCLAHMKMYAKITIPAGSDTNRLICEVELKDATWQQKHWKTLLQNYRGCPHFKLYESFFDDFYLGRRWTNLAEMNQHLL